MSDDGKAESPLPASEPEPRWRLVERLVAKLEHALTPEARINHNVRLPNLKTGHMCQCDIVIRYGAAPRETMAIVEVQDRASRVAPNDFRGWCKKREDVGAQHLICVSAHPFPESIIDEVRLLGPSVRLVTLRELERNEWPDGLGMTYIHFALARLSIDTKRAPVLLFRDKNPLGPSYALPNFEPVFQREGRPAAQSLLDILKEHTDITEESARAPEGTYRLTLDVSLDPPLYLLHNGEKWPVDLFHIPIVANKKNARFPLVCSSYEQVDYEGSLAWAMTSEGMFEEKPFTFSAIFVAEASGHFRLVSVSSRGGLRNATMWFKSEPRVVQSE